MTHSSTQQTTTHDDICWLTLGRAFKVFDYNVYNYLEYSIHVALHWHCHCICTIEKTYYAFNTRPTCLQLVTGTVLS